MKKVSDGSIISKVLKWFKNDHATSGQFVVTGEDHVTFEIKCNNVKHVRVVFADPEPMPIPCVPYIPDTLIVDFASTKGPFSILTISWKVAGIRTVAWRVKEENECDERDHSHPKKR